MRSTHNGTISADQIHESASGVLQRHLQVKDSGYRCQASVIISVLLFAASRTTSIYDACQRLRRAPSDDAVRKAVLANCAEMADLERRLNAALSDRLLKSLRRKPQRLAIDITEIPYHGQPHATANEICRRRPRSGTSHFHAYATVYVVRHGERLTLAMTYVWSDDSKAKIVQRLLRRVSQLGVSVRYLLLDRGFYTVDVVRYFQAARKAFLMPVVHCGKKPPDPTQAKGTSRFLFWKKSGWSEHRLANKKRTAKVQIAVACDNFQGRWGKRGRRTLVYAYWGFQPRSPGWAREEYRRRFGIESSYRQMNQARSRTSSRQPMLRLLFIGIALILRNLWVWLHRMLLADCLPGGHVRLRLEKLRFRTLLLQIQRLAEALLGCGDPLRSQTPVPTLSSDMPTQAGQKRNY